MMSKSQKSVLIILASPIIIMIIGNLSARFFLNKLGNWAWAGYFPVYWSMLVLFIFFTGKHENHRGWFIKSAGSSWWIVLAICIGLISFPALFFPNMHVMHSFYLVAAWFCFAIVNSMLEESYWRGFLLDGTSHFPRVFGVLYSSVLFTLIHPLNLGVFSKIQTFDPGRPMMLVPFLSILIVLSLSWSLLYLKTKSLRLSVLSHFLTDLGNLSIFLFMNMVHL
jgi:membrane protease YdiL (CAAX protease family)